MQLIVPIGNRKELKGDVLSGPSSESYVIKVLGLLFIYWPAVCPQSAVIKVGATAWKLWIKATNFL